MRLGLFLAIQCWMASWLAWQVAGQTYAIVAPDVVRPNTDYLVAVSVFGLKDEEQQDQKDAMETEDWAKSNVDLLEKILEEGMKMKEE